MQGSWFSWEKGENTLTTIDETSMSRRGYCTDWDKKHGDEYSFVFKDPSADCYHCVHLFIRTVNVVEKSESE